VCSPCPKLHIAVTFVKNADTFCLQRDSIPGPLAPQASMLPLDHCDLLGGQIGSGKNLLALSAESFAWNMYFGRLLYVLRMAHLWWCRCVLASRCHQSSPPEPWPASPISVSHKFCCRGVVVRSGSDAVTTAYSANHHTVHCQSARLYPASYVATFIDYCKSLWLLSRLKFSSDMVPIWWAF